MTTPPNPSELFSPFLPTTYNIPEEDDRLKSFLNENFANFADVVNDKKIGAYSDGSSVNFNGEKWIFITPKKVRNGFQAIVYIPSLPNSGVLIIDSSTNPLFPIKSINSQFVITKLFGTASKPPSSIGSGDGNYFMYNSEGDSRISFTFSDTTITITTTIDLSAYSGFIVCEFLYDGT